ncbi:T9SS type A sorting domain-containing protein [Fulvivirga ligni]|uniref:T9SS type A sorting domain-containing protein n=1 Tax=Fulvivirga ligni TaxID=2904246 RepID=UPI001F3D768B|nr:T9SS type A sorting domain-containing protein [Fulvivirga ligni]UII22522.1 T9SS type A sorting domain-containing protein [Fulvivirga ligni]
MIKNTLISLLVILMASITSYATHLRAGEITYELLNESTQTYNITITVYMDDTSEVSFGEGTLHFGDGTSIQLPPISSTKIKDGLSYSKYSVNHNYCASGNYLLYYSEPNRNENVVNLPNSANKLFYIESLLVLPSDKLIASPAPKTLAPLLFKGQLGDTLNYSLASKNLSPSEIKLRYDLVPCQQGRNQVSEGYFIPNEVSVNPLTGQFTWKTTANDMIGEYNFALKTSQWTKIGDNYELIGYVIRDFQIILEDIEGKMELNTIENSGLGENNSLIIPAGSSKSISFISKIQSGDSGFEVFSDLNSASLERNSDTITLQIQINEMMARENPYVVVLRSTNYLESDSLVKDMPILIYTQETEEPELLAPNVNELITSVGKLKTTSLKPYPNPVTDKFYLGADLQSHFITIIDMKGEEYNLPVESDYINVSSLPKGVFFLMIDGESYKFIKK